MGGWKGIEVSSVHSGEKINSIFKICLVLYLLGLFYDSTIGADFLHELIQKGISKKASDALNGKVHTNYL